jgi:hypothetical protein
MKLWAVLLRPCPFRCPALPRRPLRYPKATYLVSPWNEEHLLTRYIILWWPWAYWPSVSVLSIDVGYSLFIDRWRHSGWACYGIDRVPLWRRWWESGGRKATCHTLVQCVIFYLLLGRFVHICQVGWRWMSNGHYRVVGIYNVVVVGYTVVHVLGLNRGPLFKVRIHWKQKKLIVEERLSRPKEFLFPHTLLLWLWTDFHDILKKSWEPEKENAARKRNKTPSVNVNTSPPVSSVRITGQSSPFY